MQLFETLSFNLVSSLSSFELKQVFDFKSIDSNDREAKKSKVLVTNIKDFLCLKTTKDDFVDRPHSCLSLVSEEEPSKKDKEDSELKDYPANTVSNSTKPTSKRKRSRACQALQPFNKSGKKWFEGITTSTRHRTKKNVNESSNTKNY